MGTVRAARDLQYHRAVHEAIEDGHGQRGIAEVIRPSLEADVGHHGRGTRRAAAVDHFVQEAGRLSRLRPLDLVEAELVDDQQLEVAVVPQPLGETVVGQRGRQVPQQVGTGRVTDAVAPHAGSSAYGLDDV